MSKEMDRYEPYAFDHDNGRGAVVEHDLSDDGEWCMWEDIKPLQARIAALEAAQQRISVDDRLPERETETHIVSGK